MQSTLSLLHRAIPAGMPDSLSSPLDSPLTTIGEQLAELDMVAASSSSNQSFEEGLMEDLLVPGPSTAIPSVEVTTVFKRPNPPTAAVKAPRKAFTRPNILWKRRQAQSTLQDIKYLQSTHNALLQTAPYARLVRSTLKSHGDYKITSDALLCLKEASEAHLQQLIDKAKACTVHCKCMTLSVADLQLAQYLSRDLDSLGPANTKEEHRNQINQGHRAYTCTHMMYKQALTQDQAR